MPPAPDLYLTALTYELGEHEHRLDDLPGVPDDVRQALHDGGLSNYRVTDRSVVELAAGPIRRTVEALDDDLRRGIRRLVFASNSVWDESLHSPLAVSRVLDGLDLRGVVPLGVSLSWCVNVHTALDLARMLVAADGDEAVLVVCADLWPGSRPDRLVLPNVSVHTDAAASFVVTARDGPFRYRHTRLRLDPALGLLDRTRDPQQFLERAAQGVVGTVSETLEAGGVAPGDIAKVVPNNYSRFVCDWVAGLAGFEADALYLDNLPRFAHALCTDNPINLRDLADDGLAPGDRLLLLGTGPYQWGAAIVDVVRAGVAAATDGDDDGDASRAPLC